MALATVALAVVSAVNVYYTARHQWLSGMPRLMAAAMLDQDEATVALYNFGPAPVLVFKMAVARAPTCKGPFESLAAYSESVTIKPGGSAKHTFSVDAKPREGDWVYFLIEMAYAGTPGVWSHCFFEMKREGPGAYRMQLPFPAFCRGDFSHWWYWLCCHCRGFWGLVRYAARWLVSRLCACGCGEKKEPDHQENGP